VPDEQWGERPKAAAVEFVDALPQTSTGKIQKYELREREWQGQASRIKG
jgi:fatty-acyl-CoA synthase